MRLTTKITIGIILSVFIISLATIIAFSFSDRKKYKSRFQSDMVAIPLDQKTGIDINSYQVIVLDKEQTDTEVNYYWNTENCCLTFNPVTIENERNKIFMPEALSDFVTINIFDDTLTVKVNVEELRKKYLDTNKYNIVISGLQFNLHTSAVNVVNKLNDVRTEIRNIETDNIDIKTSGDVTIYGCNTDKAAILSGSLKIIDSKIKELNLDLDHMRSWKIENCTIEVENLTGGNNHNIQQPKDEAEKINWLPKNKDARLNVTLYGDTSQIVFP